MRRPWCYRLLEVVCIFALNRGMVWITISSDRLSIPCSSLCMSEISFAARRLQEKARAPAARTMRDSHSWLRFMHVTVAVTLDLSIVQDCYILTF